MQDGARSGGGQRRRGEQEWERKARRLGVPWGRRWVDVRRQEYAPDVYS